MKRSLLILFVLSHIQLNGQLTRLWDSLRYDLKQEKSLYVCLDGKNSILQDQKIKLAGIQAGYTYNNRTNLFVGYYWNKHVSNVIIENPTAGFNRVDANTLYSRRKIHYFNFGTESYIVNSKKWRMSIPISFGIGKGYSESFKINPVGKEVIVNSYNKNIYPLEIGFYINYKITWWIWAGAGMGSRFALNGGEFSGSYYTYGLSLRFGEIYNRSRDWYLKKNANDK